MLTPKPAMSNRSPVLLIVCLMLFILHSSTGQSIAELEKQLPNASTKEEQWDIQYKLAKNWLVDDLQKASAYAQKATQLAVGMQDKKRQAEATFIQADIALRSKQPLAAIALYTRVRELATAVSISDLTIEAVENLHRLTAKQGDYKAAYQWSQERATLLQEKSRRYADEQHLKHEAAQKELGAQKTRENRILLAVLAGFVVVLTMFYYARQRTNRRIAGEFAEKNALIEEKRRRSEQLLLNILPRAVAAELTVRNKVAARRYERATVMFVDIVGFTHAAEKLQPEELVAELDYCFSRFDTIVGRYRIEKIKTVGDAYICASGLSDRNERPTDMIRAALEMQTFLQKLHATRLAEDRPHFEARIGIHFGPVVAGVVGAKKFAYDIWGDTVNTAARMEETCEPGRVNVSGPAYEIVQTEFQWVYRGKVAAKNKAEMEMYYVTLD